MHRRTFLASALAAVAGLLCPALAPAHDPGLRAVRRWSGRRWVRCRMCELRTGDVFTLEDYPGLQRAMGMPYRHPTGCWSVDAMREDYVLTPASTA